MGRRLKEKMTGLMFMLAACAAVAAVVLICAFLFSQGIPAIRETGAAAFVFGREWRPSAGQFGIFPMLAGSIIVTAGALAAGVPLGLLTAVFMVWFCPESLYRAMKPAVGLLAGIPSVVYGFFGLTVIVPIVRSTLGGRGLSTLAASLLLGLMILPTVISVCEAALRAVPESCYEGSAALGATHEYSVFCSVVPAASRGITAGVMLGFGRAAGETMAVMMVAGNQPVIPGRLTDGVRTLTANIALEMGYASGRHRGALLGSAAVLFVLVLITNMVFSFFRKGHDTCS